MASGDRASWRALTAIFGSQLERLFAPAIDSLLAADAGTAIDSLEADSDKVAFIIG